MGVLSFIAVLIIGVLFSASVMLFFNKKIVLGIIALVLSIIAYIGYVWLAGILFDS